ncbi:MAG: hypothetical protein K0U52_00695 [Gammaproteobacteria bacterium]|nr:hypothetical protein [Gammaproteobacteria bacterium]
MDFWKWKDIFYFSRAQVIDTHTTSHNTYHHNTNKHNTLNNPHNQTCSICLEQDVNMRLVHCQHSFHLQCLSKWLIKSSTCPMCRATIDAALLLSM